MPEFIRDPLRPRVMPVKNPAFAARWKRQHDWCQVCGRTAGADMTCHHILGGRCGRSDEACNLIICCWSPCHMLFEGYALKINGHKLPKLTIGIALSMKIRAGELTDADLARLQELNGKRLPDPAPIPVEFDRAFRLNRGEATNG